MRNLFAVFFVALSMTFAHAVEVGDVVWLSSNGVGETVLAVRRPNRDTVELTTRKMDANASEFCERYEQLSPDGPKWKKCVRENVAPSPRRIAVNCPPGVSFTATVGLSAGAPAAAMPMSVFPDAVRTTF